MGAVSRCARRLSTPELRSALIILRQYCDKFSALKEWGDSVAHRKRNKEITFQRGVDLWIEKFLVNAYFSREVPQLKKIPIPIFEKLLTLLEDPNMNLNFGGIDTQSRFPGGYSIEEIVASIKFMYRKSPKEHVYKLFSGENADDLELMQYFIAKLKTSNWGNEYFHFDEVRDDIASILEKLIGADHKVIQKNEQYLAAHFLAAFHLTEIDLKDCDRSTKKRCFLSVGADADFGGYLSLNLGLYHRKNGAWDIVKLKNSNPNRLESTTDCSRLFFATDLLESEYYSKNDWPQDAFKKPIEVESFRNGKFRLMPVK